MKNCVTPLTEDQLNTFLEALKPIVAALAEHQIKDVSRFVNRTRREIYLDKNFSHIICRDDMVLSQDQEQRILAAYKPNWDKYRLSREILIDTGARVAMVARLKREDIDFDNARITLFKNKLQGRPEGKALPPTPLSIETFLHLKEFVAKNWKDIDHHEGYVFFSEPMQTGRKPKKYYAHVLPVTIRRYYWLAKKRAGLISTYGKSRIGFNPRTGKNFTRTLYRYRLHDSRTSLIRRAVWQHNLPPALVSEMLGITIDTVMHYAGEAPQELRDRAFEKVQSPS